MCGADRAGRVSGSGIAYAGGVRRRLGLMLWSLWSPWLFACGDGEAMTVATAMTSDTSDTGDTGPADPTGGEFVPLVLPMDWQQVPAPQDPLVSHRPAEVSCPLGAWLYEPQGLEVNTGLCNYGMFVQPSRAAIVPGARLRASLYHFDLSSEPPATAHVALMLAEAVIWEQDIAVPGKANAYAIDLTLDFTAAAGTPVYFHLHNHGQNTWTLGEVEVEVFAP